MRVALVSYPTLFQRVGGLQVQVRDSLAALRGIGVEAALFDGNRDSFADFDLVHVFAAINGNYRIVEAAKEAGLPVVISTVLHPPWTRWDRLKAEWCDRLVGRITGWSVTTSYRQIATALGEADRVIALGSAETRLIEAGYGIAAAKVRVVPNGIAEAFFTAEAATFRARTGIEGPFLLCVASISPYKNQLALAEAARDLGLRVVLIGPVAKAHEAYLEACRAALGERLTHLGTLDHDDPLLASAYAAAGLFALVSRSEVAPISAMEALAAGTPVLLTAHNSLDLPRRDGALAEVEPGDPAALRAEIARRLAEPVEAEACRAPVRGHSWEAVARQLKAIYEELL